MSILNTSAAVDDPPPPDLRERLLTMRSALIEGMTAAPILEPGHLALLGHVGAALAAIAAADLPADWRDQDGIGSYNEAVKVFRERHLAGEPLPEMFRRRSD